MKVGELPIGAKIKTLGTKPNGESLSWIKIAHNHLNFPENSTTLLSSKIIYKKSFDGGEKNNTIQERVQNGNNNYSYSNIRQFLNSNKLRWYQDQHDFDEPPIDENVTSNPYGDNYGFLTSFTEDFREMLLKTNVEVLKPDIDGGGVEILSDKVFLLSSDEVGVIENNIVKEGQPFNIFSSNDKRVVLFNDSPSSWMLRSSLTNTYDTIKCVSKDGTVEFVNANNGDIGIRPCVNISNNIEVSDEKDIDGSYIIIRSNEKGGKIRRDDLSNELLEELVTGIKGLEDIDAEDVKLSNGQSVESQMADFTHRFNKESMEISRQDLNDIKDTGFYKGTNIVNAPDNGTFYISVIQYDSSRVYQEAVSLNGEKYYGRVLVNGEWRKWMSRTVGDLSTLKTTDKKSLVSSINELFQFADNGKKNVATVIGSPLTSTDTFDSMKSKIQTMKNTFASNLTVKEQSSSGSESLESLINKVKNINPQKKWAEGEHRQRVESDAESTRNVNFNVSLSWKPSCIAVFKKESYYNYEVTIAMFVTDSTFKNALTTNIYSSRLDKFNFIHSDRSKISILSDTSFKVLDYTQSSATYYWLAIEL